MSIVTVFKVVELNRCTTLNSVGGLLGLALEIESYNVNRNSVLNSILPIHLTPPLTRHCAPRKGTA